MKRLLLSATLLPLLGASPREESLAFGYEAGDEVTRTFEAKMSYGIDHQTLSVNGEEHDMGDEGVDVTLDTLERIVVVDEILEVEDGRPTDFRRTFQELLQESSTEWDEESVEATLGSDLEGVVVRFLWDDGDEEFYAEFDDPDVELDAGLLEHLRPDMDFALLLPSGEVEEGDEWSIDAEAYLTLMWPGGLLGFYDEDDETEPDAFQTGLSVQGIENIDGEGTVTFEGVRDEDGVRVAVLSVELEITTESSGEVEEGEVELELEFERELTGEVLWDLEHGCVLSASFAADSEWTRTETSALEYEGEEYDMERATTYTGTIAYEVTLERE